MDTPAGRAASRDAALPLVAWIDGALREAGAAASPAYVAAALRVAHALAADVAQQSTALFRDEGTMARARRPAGAARPAWRDRATVRVRSLAGDVAAGAGVGAGLEEFEDLQAMLNAIIPDQSLYLDDSDEEGPPTGAAAPAGAPVPVVNPLSKSIASGYITAGDAQGTTGELTAQPAGGASVPTLTAGSNGASNAECDPDYLDVVAAKLALTEDDLQRGGVGGRIRDLGLLFLDLFSGGKERHTPPATSSPPSPTPLLPFDATCPLDGPGEEDELLNAIAAGGTAQASKRRSDANLPAVENLRALGLPASLCDVVGNMVDLGADDAYGTVEDAAVDLRLLFESPDIYLRGFGTDPTHATGPLRTDDDVVGRDAELGALRAGFRCATASPGGGAAIVMGAGGTGKSALARWLLRDVGEGGGVTLTGKFDRLQRSSPFSALAAAFDGYCEWLAHNGDDAVAGRVTCALREELGRQEQRVLTGLMPHLSNILKDGPRVDHEVDNSFYDKQQKGLGIFFWRLVRLVCRAHVAPMVLWLDDLQWSDSASIALLGQMLQLLRSDSNEAVRFFFLGCIRDDEAEEHPLWSTLDATLQDDVTRISLDCLNRNGVNMLISRRLGLLPRLTRPLAEVVHHKTKGNPFFVSQMLTELNREGLLRPSLRRRRWVWEEDKIRSRQLQKDVIEFLTASLRRLPDEVLFALGVLSCFGSSTDRTLVEKLERETGMLLLLSLETAVAQGFILEKHKRYCFVHDRVQEAVYMSVKPEERRSHHFSYGMALCNVATREKDTDLGLSAVSQFNLSSPEAASKEERLKIAFLNLQSGKKTTVSDFSATWYFESGISFLPDGHWENNYELSLALYNGAARCSVFNGEKHARLKELSDQVLKHARCLEDKLEMLFITMRLLIFESKLLAAIEHGFGVLSQIGVITFDYQHVTAPDVVHFVKETKSMLNGLSDDGLLNYNIQNDPKMEIAMHFLVKLSEAMAHIRQSDQPVVILTMVQLSLKHGMNSLSPLGFALYGSFLAGMGHMQEGYRYSKLSKVMLDKFGSSQIRGEVFAYTSQLAAHFEPLQSVTEYHTFGTKAALASGNMRFGLLNSLFYTVMQFYSGGKLGKIKSAIDESLSLMKQQNHLMLFVMMMPIGRTVSTLYAADLSIASIISERDSTELEEKLRGNNLTQSKAIDFQKMLIAYMFRRFDEAKELAIKCSHVNVRAMMILFHQQMQVFWCGLVAYWIGREENSKEWIAKGHKAKLTVQKLVEFSKWNFEGKLFLLEAERQFCERDFELAEKYYDAAILSAHEHHFVNEEALSLELAAFFYLETGRRSRSIQFFSRAIEKYHEWEARAKVLSLKTYLERVKNNLHTLSK